MFKLSPDQITAIGSGMKRPECVLATRSGDLFCSDARGGYNIVKPDGQASLFLSEVEGVPLPPVNFVGLDAKGRI